MIYLFGAGYMGEEYIRVLNDFDAPVSLVARTETRLEVMRNKYDVVACFSGGFEGFTKPAKSGDLAIVCLPIEKLAACAKKLLSAGFKKILVEKPVGLSNEVLIELKTQSLAQGGQIFVAYNRRFFSSVLHLKSVLEREELVAVHFEISEWAHKVDRRDYDSSVLDRWFIANTSHVVDLALHLAGDLRNLTCNVTGALDWHSSGSRFSGTGTTEHNVMLSYNGYWDCPGRWSLEFLTREHKYILRPMEKIYVQELNSVTPELVKGIDYTLDEQFKPGLHNLVRSFIGSTCEDLCTLDEQINRMPIYMKMAGYEVS